MLSIGLLFLSQSFSLPIGSWNHPGPGALPNLYSICLVCGGAVLMWRSSFQGVRWPSGTINLFQVALLFGAFVVFALLIRSAGLLIAAPAALGLAYVAASGRSVPELVILIIGITAGSVLLFTYALGLPIPLIVLGW